VADHVPPVQPGHAAPEPEPEPAPRNRATRLEVIRPDAATSRAVSRRSPAPAAALPTGRVAALPTGRVAALPTGRVAALLDPPGGAAARTIS
jgi:hypothetical protein